MTKRVALRAHSSPRDVYVTRSTRFGALMSRVQSLLRRGSEAHLHGMGAALTRCADVAMAVQRAAGAGAVTISVTTGTIYVIDDFTPLVPGLPARTRKRAKNVLHIVIKPTENFI
jgi:hypothetical protein